MDLLRTLSEIRPGESCGCDGGNVTLPDVTWYSQKIYTLSEYEELEDKSNLLFNEEAGVYTEAPFTIPTQQECEECWNSKLGSEIALKELRAKRNTLLEQTDRYATLDFPHSNLVVQQTWFDYRQALRDLPTVTEDPANPVWPVQPSP
jgi:hypothetical protein